MASLSLSVSRGNPDGRRAAHDVGWVVRGHRQDEATGRRTGRTASAVPLTRRPRAHVTHGLAEGMTATASSGSQRRAGGTPSGWSWVNLLVVGSSSTTAPGTPAYKRISTIRPGVLISTWSPAGRNEFRVGHGLTSGATVPRRLRHPINQRSGRVLRPATGRPRVRRDGRCRPLPARSRSRRRRRHR
jgi:hypothetical protein